MKTSVIHLSDIHLKARPASNSILARVLQLRGAIRQRSLGQDACLIIASGDIAYSGKSDEYRLAVAFFKDLLNGLAEDLAPALVRFIVVPGNHDCDFSRDNDIRRIILNSALTTTFSDHSALDQCLVVQENYRDFAKTLQTECANVTCTLLTSSHDNDAILIGDTRVLVQLLNSAWTSQIHEAAGTLSFPVYLLPPAPTRAAASDLVISVIHHPLNWFDPDNGRELRRYLEDTSDIILTGHEHVPGAYVRHGEPGPNNEYLEGGVLQDSSRPDDSTFNVVQIDMSELTLSTETFTWMPHTGMYRSPNEPRRVRTFRRNQQRLRTTLPFAPIFDRWLHDPGVHLSHPTKHSLLLEDIFVHPDFRETAAAEPQESSAIVQGNRFLDLIIEHKHVVVFGGEVSGKTTLAKVILGQLRSRGLTPLYLGADTHLRLASKTLESVLADAAAKQYGTEQVDRFLQVAPAERVLVIDDYQRLPIQAGERHALLTAIAQSFEIVVLFATDEVRIEEFGTNSVDVLSLWEFKHLDLLEMGFAKRSELCRKWYGPTIQSQTDVANAQIFFARVESQLSAVIGEQVIPAYPLFLLMLLQQLELAKKDSLVSGSVGYLYEAMVILQLDAANSRYADIDTNKNYLAELAYHLFCNGNQHLPVVEFAIWHQKYCAQYTMTLDSETQRQTLSRAGLLCEHHGMLGFKYPYHFYYFVAEYFAAHISEPVVREQVKTLTTFLHQTQAANVVLFLCHRSRDRFILDAVCETASGLFESHAQCQLDDDVKNLALGVRGSEIRLESRGLGRCAVQA